MRYVMKQKFWAWGDDFVIRNERDEDVYLVDGRAFSWGKFTVDVPGPDDLEAQGNFLDHEYTFERGGEVVAHVSKRWFKWTDTYGIEVEGADDVLVLASAVVIDMVCHQESKRH
jgi:uncharacterized protein YxjI